ncbi:MAG: GNAT family N-acetyltransferase [Ruminococcus sp.]|nr:GNAT family N-acetyltransferase [Ruminococcus sp.]
MNEGYRDILYSCYPRFNMSLESFERLMIHEDTHIIPHYEDGVLAGFALVDAPAVRLICVRPEYQRRGIGSALLAEAESYSAEQGFDRLLTGGVSSKFLIGADKSTAGFFEKKGYDTVGGCDEMLLELDKFSFDESAFRGHLCAEYGWYEGSTEALHKAVAEVKESWVKLYDGSSPVYAATVGGELASFCMVTKDVKNYLSDAYGRVGMPGCVGTVPRFRDRGIGIEMIARVTQYLKDSGMDISHIFFTGVADWYKKLGYETFMTEVFMEKQFTKEE